MSVTEIPTSEPGNRGGRWQRPHPARIGADLEDHGAVLEGICLHEFLRHRSKGFLSHIR